MLEGSRAHSASTFLRTGSAESAKEHHMPVATPDQYAQMLDNAKSRGFAYPAFNVSSSQTLNAVLQGLTEAGSDGIIQVTTGGADYFAGHTVKARATGALAFAKFAHEVAKSYPITVALHTDHCPKNALDDFVRPLIAASQEEIKAGRNPIFQSHMWDGSAVPLKENLEIAKEMLALTKSINAILEVEIGVVGGEEDGVSHDINESLYTTVEDGIATVEALGLGENGRYMAAMTFGNVHGVYKPGNVQLRPELLKEIQDGVAAKFGTGDKPFDLVFHGGSGSTDEEIATAVANGVIKMNIDTDTQYAFTRSVADTMFKNYDGVLKVDGEVGNKKIYDPRAWGKLAETAMAARVVQATHQLGSAGHAGK
jgi:fructose-bisphosphate aldolase class II